MVKMNFKFGRSTPQVLTSHSQDEFKFGRSTPRSAGRSIPQYWQLMIKMSSDLADLPLDLLTDLHPSTDIWWSRWVQIWQIYPLVLTSHGQDEFKFGRSIPRSAGRATPLAWTSHGQDELKFGRSTPTLAGSYNSQYWHLMVKMSSNMADLLLDMLAELHP